MRSAITKLRKDKDTDLDSSQKEEDSSNEKTSKTKSSAIIGKMRNVVSRIKTKRGNTAGKKQAKKPPSSKRGKTKAKEDSDSDSEVAVSPSTKSEKTSKTSATTPDTDKAKSPQSDESSKSENRKKRKQQRDERNKGKSFENTDKVGLYHVIVRIIEGRDLPGNNLRMRVNIDGRTESTRVSSESDPRWRQNLSFTLNRSLEQIADTELYLKLYSQRRLLSDQLLGEWSTPLSTILQEPNRLINSKWVALKQRAEDGEYHDAENVGFVRISVAIYADNEGAPSLIDNDSEEVFSGASLQHFTLRIRLFRLRALDDILLAPFKIHKLRTNHPPVYQIRIKVGDYTEICDIREVEDAKTGRPKISFDQEITLPIMWPTVINSIQFALVLSKGKRAKRIIAKSSILLSSIYEAGSQGFLPTFGPSFINFYGAETIASLKRKWQTTEAGIQEHLFYGRLLVAVDCIDLVTDETTISHISHECERYAQQFEEVYKYSLCGTLFNCCNIDPNFASSAISFAVSIGTEGSTVDGKWPRSTSVPVMPNHDGAKYYTLPWGNFKPLVSIDCNFDNVAFRLERTNAILKVVAVIDQCLEEARVAPERCPETIASITVEAIGNVYDMLENLMQHHKSQEMCTALDFERHRISTRAIEEMQAELIELKYHPFTLGETVDEAFRIMTRIRHWVKKLAVDDSASLPDIFVKMYADCKLVGMARIPATRVFFSRREALRGDLCAKIHAYPIRYLQMNKQQRKAEKMAAVLHAKLWVGNRNRLKHWSRAIQPAEQKSYLEIYQLQRKRVAGFKDEGYLSLDGADLSQYVSTPPEGFAYKGTWFMMNTHTMWLNHDQTGRKQFIDKLFELHWRKGGKQEGSWEHKSYTDYYGNRLSAAFLKENPQDGWVWVDDWQVDKTGYGDKDGWCYSATDRFWGDEEMRDDEERKDHLFRRRCMQRMRRMKTYNEEDENLSSFVSHLGPDEAWEYARTRNGSYHDSADGKDEYRRRRFVKEIVKDDSANFILANIPRMYESHNIINKWKCRAYIMWGKEILPTSHQRIFVRVMFMTACKETSVVQKSQHPVWNETLAFDEMVIPGAQHGLKDYPPSVLVEVKGERRDETEEFLGRFEVKPVVILSKSDRRGKLAWHTLHFKNNKTRGALLALFELFLSSPDVDNKNKNKESLPLPNKKKTIERVTRYEIPKELWPKFQTYTVQALMWGVRNLRRHQLLSVRRPSVEIVVGDEDASTGPLADVTKDPNYEEPFLTFDRVRLPQELHLAPPIVLNLYDSRAFRRLPLIGSCAIPDIKKYIRKVVKREKSVSHNHVVFEEFVEKQENIVEHLIDRRINYKTVEDDEEPDLDELRIDWWSKYYASAGMPERAPGYEETGNDKLCVYPTSLESLPEFQGFEDFLDTFKFTKSAKGHFDDSEEKEVVGQLKGKLFITACDGDKPSFMTNPPGVEFTGPVECIVRLYVVGATGLIAPRSSGVVDPYVVARMGKNKIKLRKNYRADTTEPEFGEMLEFKVSIPIVKDLVITLMDRNRIVADEEIGSTCIDLENRLLSKYRGTVGISEEFILRGGLAWRDQCTPVKILHRYCKKMLLPAPEVIYEEEVPVGLRMLGMSFLSKDLPAPKDPLITGPPIQRAALFILHKMGLVPEHVETRTLYNTLQGNVPCGSLRCFVDIFPASIGVIPPPLDISPRKPEPFQLRLALFNVTNALLMKRSFGKPCADLFFKVFVNGNKKPQKTDIHYRVTDGYGSFNWRFLLDFDYNPWERKVYMYEKTRLLKKARQELVDPLIILQLWDNNKFKKNGFIGEYAINLLDIEFGKMSEGEIKRVRYASDRRRCSCWCVTGCLFVGKACLSCCLCRRVGKNKKKEVIPLPRAPRYSPPVESGSKSRPASLFDTYATRGIWPMLSRTVKKEQRLDDDAKKKKDDDFDPTVEYVVGCVELELQLLTKAEAEAEPVGRKRNKPNQNPFLDKPDRATWNSFWLTSRFKPLVAFIWKKFGIQCVTMTICILCTLLVVGAILWRISEIPFTIFG